MRGVLVSVVVASQLAGCITYGLNAYEPKGDVAAILGGAEVAVGLGVGVAMKVSENSLGSLGEDLLAGIAGIVLIDLAIGLGVRVSDFTNSAAPEARSEHMLRLGGSF